MSIFDKFKSKKQPAKEEKSVVREIKVEKREKSVAEKAKKPKAPVRRVEKKQFSDAYRILRSPHVTEKAGMLADKNNSYVFKVGSSVNKNAIKEAVQNLYGVAVDSVNIINIPKKARRVGRNEGFKPGFKKAIVKLVEGEKIEIMPR